MFAKLLSATGGVLTISMLGLVGCSDTGKSPNQSIGVGAGANPATDPDAGTGTGTPADVTLDAGQTMIPVPATQPDPGADPDAGTDPDPSTDPVASPDAGADPDAGTDADAGADPDAGTDPDPVTETGSDIATVELVRDMGPGWNLGNSFDSCSSRASDEVDETFWGNPRVTEELFLALKSDGIKSIRIPVTWRHHLGRAPDYLIDGAWMNRVQQVVDYAVDNDLYAIINLHHDGGDDPEGGAWIKNASTDYEGTMEQYEAVWSQIAERFSDYPELLIFESMNEVGFDDLPQAEAFALLNTMNQEFVDLIRASGGNNPTRHLLIAGYWTDIPRTCDGTVMPTDPARRCILSVHYYTPWQFCITGENRTWGTQAEIDELFADFEMLKTSFIDQGYPVILGEYGASSSTETASRAFWTEYVTKVAYDMGVAPYLWDNGGEFNRYTYEWSTRGLLEALLRATSGEDYTVTRQ